MYKIVNILVCDVERFNLSLFLLCPFFHSTFTVIGYILVFPDLYIGNFYSQSLVPDPQKLGARVLSDAYMINPKFILSIYGIVF